MGIKGGLDQQVPQAIELKIQPVLYLYLPYFLIHCSHLNKILRFNSQTANLKFFSLFHHCPSLSPKGRVFLSLPSS